jgi:precorrin-6Y C5,15-methyltransferase (decarboxylating)
MKLYIIGIDDNKEPYFTPEITELIASHSVFSGGIRHHAIVNKLLPENHQWINIAVPLENTFREYEKEKEIVVFASGDPLFFGFANTVRRMVPDADICLFPYFNSLQILAHRLLMPYQDMHIVSLTGRTWHKFDEALITGYDTIGVLTDNKEHTPETIAKRMLDYGYDNYTASIGELLGNKEQEKISVLALQEVAGKPFTFPNNLILRKTYPRPRPFGIPESAFDLLDGRTKMITKMPVRLLSLSLLELRNKTVFWDVGFCTGSVSIEAKMQFPHLQIVAFEQRPEGRDLMENNCRKWGTPGILTVIADFTYTDVSSLPRPDAAFIGGYNGEMEKIIEKLAGVLQPGGVIVFNSVSETSRNLFLKISDSNGFRLEENISIKVNHFNTIEIIKVRKQTIQ